MYVRGYLFSGCTRARFYAPHVKLNSGHGRGKKAARDELGGAARARWRLGAARARVMRETRAASA